MSTKNRTFVFRLFGVFVLLTLMLGTRGVTPAHGGGGIRYAKPSATGTGNCSSWANACTLQTALTGAVSGNHIWVMAGTHKPTTETNRTATFQLKSGVAVLGGFNGTEIDITDEDKRDPVTNVTILSGEIGAAGNSDNSYHVVAGVNVTGATLDGFTITAGNANDSQSPNYMGGGMYNDSSSPTLKNLIFSSNSASYGGGMSNKSSSPTLTNVTFSDNSAGRSGGGMYNDSSNPTLMNVTFSNNNSAFDGGGMSSKSSNPTLTNVTFSSNPANDGGGMSNKSSNPILTNVTFNGNSASATNGNGGGMYNVDSSSPTLTNVTFSVNSAGAGGGMYNYSSSPTINNTIFWGNTATSGWTQICNNSSTPVLSDNVIQGGCPVGSTCMNIISANPMLGTLGNYGGFTQTFPLLAGSSAIDTGNDETCASTGDDQRGVTRPQRAHCDIGAYEAKALETITFISTGSRDGWMLESSETSGVGGSISAAASTLRIGDDAAKKQYRSILSFSTGASLPDNAIITKLTLKIRRQGVIGGGNPVTAFQGIYADIKKGYFGTTALQTADFQTTASKTYGPFKPALSDNWYGIDLTGGKSYINKLSTSAGLTQIRMRFKLDDNNNTVANYLSLYSGNASSSYRPQLIVEYYVP
jgi:hypothetical protein